MINQSVLKEKYPQISGNCFSNVSIAVSVFKLNILVFFLLLEKTVCLLGFDEKSNQSKTEAI